MTVTTLLLILFILISGFSFYRIRIGRKGAEFIYHWGFVMGSFVWEDAFIFGLLGTIACLITLLIGEAKYGYLLLLLFWLVRSGGETLYWFLQQFIVPRHLPHYVGKKYNPIKIVFGDITEQQFFILLQVFYQSIMVLCLFGLTLLLINWNTL